MATVKKADEGILINMERIEKKTVQLRLIGDSPLITHCWSEKARKQMLDSMTGASKGKKKPPKRPVIEFIDSLYWLSHKPELPDDASDEDAEIAFQNAVAAGAQFGFPAIGIKLAANSAAYRLGWVRNQMQLRGCYYIEPDVGDCVIIKGDAPIMREDCVTVGMGGTDLRYRGQFNNWYMDIRLTYTTAFNFPLESLINVINAGGFACGIGEWRVERDGQYGCFHVETA